MNSAHGLEKLRQLTQGQIDASILQIVFIKFRQLLFQKWLDVNLAYHSIYRRLKILSLLLWVSNGCKLASDAQQPWLIWHDDVAMRIEATGEITNQTLDRMEDDLKLWLISAQNKTLQCSHSRDYPDLISNVLRGILIQESRFYQMRKNVEEHIKEKDKLMLMNGRLSQLNDTTRRQNSSLQDMNRKLEEEKSELKAKNDELGDQNNRLELKVIFLDIELEGKNQQVTDLAEEKEAIRQDKLRKIEELEEDNMALEGDNLQLQANMHGLQTNVQGLQTNVQDLQANVQRLQGTMRQLEAIDDDLQADNEDLTDRTQGLELQLRISNVELRRERNLRRAGSDYMWN